MDVWREWGETDAREWIPVPSVESDKYSRGVLGAIIGSTTYPGAAVLGVDAACRTGIGMVRYIGPRDVRCLVLARRPEAVTVRGRVDAWLFGSGMDATDRSSLMQAELSQALASGRPVVLDAGALDLAGTGTGPTVITPHAGELSRLLTERGIAAVSADDVRAEPDHWAARAADELGVTVLLKGSVTRIADPEGARLLVTHAPSWLATAGTGDILAGVLAALLAAHSADLRAGVTAAAPLAATAAFLHAAAARRASGGGPIVALDVSDALPATIAAILAG